MASNKCLLSMLFVFSACESVVQPCPVSSANDVVYVVGQGGHAEIGIPAEELDNNLIFYREIFPNARVIMFGYGKKTFITAPPDTISEYFLGPLPGPAVIQVVALSVRPQEAYPEGDMITLVLPPGGRQTLSNYIWNDLSKDRMEKPQIVAPSRDPAGLFYSAASEYNPLHTCNTWTAAELHMAGLPVSDEGVIFSGQVMSRAEEAAESQCQSLR